MEEAFTVHISSRLARKLLSESEPVKKKTRKPKPKTAQEHKPVEANQNLPSHDLKKLHDPLSGGWPLQPPPVFIPAVTQKPVNPEIDAIRTVLKESEQVLEKLQKREENMVQEVTQRAKDLYDKEFKLPNRKPLPCLNERDACTNCYKEHPNAPLKCAQFVKDFADCARKAKQLNGSAQ